MRIKQIREYGNKTVGPIPQYNEWAIIGREMAKVQFWASKYDLSFQFWGEDNNNVYVSRDGVDIASFGGEQTPLEIIKILIEWCEKTNPSVRYPEGIDITNPQP